LNVTPAPDAGFPPFVTNALIETVVGGTKVLPDADMLTANVGGVITVAFAASVVVEDVFDALKLTAYVPAGVPDGAPLSIVTEADCPGLSVSDDEENAVAHPEGSVDPRLIVLDPHADESLSLTETE